MATAHAAAEACVETGFEFLRHLRRQRPEARCGLSLPQLRALHVLESHPDTSLGELAAQFGVSPPAMSKMAEALVERGLAARAAAPDDRRRIALALTPAGADALARARAALVAELAERMRAVAAGERAQMVRAMRQLQGVLSPGVAA